MNRRAVYYALLASLVVFLVAVNMKTPRHERTWQPHLSRLPIVSLEGDKFSIREYRNWTYPKDEVPVQTWETLSDMDVTDVKRVWLVVEPHPGLDVMAHTLVLFEFKQGEMIGLTVEARKQADETYSALRGTFNAFELIYQWASPRDLLTRRAVYMDKALYMYPLVLSHSEAEAYLRTLLEQTQHIEDHPRFYNTLTSNCTNELAKSAGLAWHPAFVLTGGADKALFEMGRIAGPRQFDVVKAHARIDGLVIKKASRDEAAFNAALVSGH